MLEINQAGLSWLTILNKRSAFRVAYDDFDVDKVADFGAPTSLGCSAIPGSCVIGLKSRLQSTMPGVSRSCVCHTGRSLFGSTPIIRARWRVDQLFRRTFRFTGGQIVNEFLMSLGYLPGAHEPDCPAFARISALSPPWMRAAAN